MMAIADDVEMVQVFEVAWVRPIHTGPRRGEPITVTFHAAHRPKCKRLKKPEDGMTYTLASEVPISTVDAWLACYSCLPELMPVELQPTAPHPSPRPGKPKTTRGLRVLSRVNLYAGRCAKCNSTVAKGSGFLAERTTDGGGWAVVHRDGECHERTRRHR